MNFLEIRTYCGKGSLKCDQLFLFWWGRFEWLTCVKTIYLTGKSALTRDMIIDQLYLELRAHPLFLLCAWVINWVMHSVTSIFCSLLKYCFKYLSLYVDFFLLRHFLFCVFFVQNLFISIILNNTLTYKYIGVALMKYCVIKHFV